MMGGSLLFNVDWLWAILYWNFCRIYDPVQNFSQKLFYFSILQMSINFKMFLKSSGTFAQQLIEMVGCNIHSNCKFSTTQPPLLWIVRNQKWFIQANQLLSCAELQGSLHPQWNGTLMVWKLLAMILMLRLLLSDTLACTWRSRMQRILLKDNAFFECYGK